MDPFLTISKTPDDNVETKVDLVFDDPFAFGMAFVDAARVIALAYAKHEQATSSVDYLNRIRQGFDAEFDKMTTDVTMNET